MEYRTKLEVSLSELMIMSGVNQFKTSNIKADKYQAENTINARLMYFGSDSTKKGKASAITANKVYNMV
jgi:hypothetical protein